MYNPEQTPDAAQSQTQPDRTEQTADTGGKTLKPTPEHYAELQSLFDWLNRSFYKNELAAPMFTLVNAVRGFGVYVPEKWNHVSGTSRPEFRLSPLAFTQADFETKAMELMRLMEKLRQGKTQRTNYHDRDYATGMKAHGLQTHRFGDADRETGERITLSVIPGGRFEKLVGKKQEGAAPFSWEAVPDPLPQSAAEKEHEADKEPQSKNGTRLKYVCPFEGCGENVRGRARLRQICQGHPDKFPEPHPPTPMTVEE